jgi:hypothetical protein
MVGNRKRIGPNRISAAPLVNESKQQHPNFSMIHTTVPNRDHVDIARDCLVGWMSFGFMIAWGYGLLAGISFTS